MPQALVPCADVPKGLWLLWAHHVPAQHPLEHRLRAGSTNSASLETLLRTGSELRGHHELSALSLQRRAGADTVHPALVRQLALRRLMKGLEIESMSPGKSPASGTVLLGGPACFQSLEKVTC